MKTRTVLTALFASFAAGVVGWQFSAVELSSRSAHTPATGTSTLQSPTQTGASSTSSEAATTPAAFGGTITGASVDTRYGSVQVKVTVVSGSITDVIAVHLTDRGGKSVQISNYAAPILRGEVLASQSANVSNVSGATYTTDAYLSSLQSALDQIAG